MEFSEKLIALRRRAGWSQEQLADRLGVTRQSVSKWEGGAAAPELGKLIALSELFAVSVDYLVKDYLEEDPAPAPVSDTARLEEKVDDLARCVKGRIYAYDSKARIFGLPLVSVRVGLVRGQRLAWENVARGVLAIGNAAVGVVAIGIVGVGAVSLSILAVGLLALGVVAMGLAAFGVSALGILAVGVVAMGAYAGGVSAVGREIAVGVTALGKTAVGYAASGEDVLLWGDGLTHPQVEAFLQARHPDLWRPLLDLLSRIGAHIK